MSTIDRISELISEKYPSDYAFADAFGIPQKMVYDWKNDRSKTYMKLLPRIAEHFGVSAAYLLCETDVPYPIENAPATSEGDGRRELFWELFSKQSPDVQEAILILMRERLTKE